MSTKEERDNLIQEIDEVLGMFRMKVKGYSKNGEDPPEQCSKDGVSVGITGSHWENCTLPVQT
jgi:hypothetical protein